MDKKLNKKVNTEKNPNSLNMINRQISACEKQLDNLIFSIYNLNDELKLDFDFPIILILFCFLVLFLQRFLQFSQIW